MASTSLTARQQQILNLIKQHIDETGYPPTRAEIATELGFRSPNAAEEHLRALARKGMIEMISGASRGIRLLDEQPAGLPLIGRVAAGDPVLAAENIEDYLDIGANLFNPRADYLLRVHGMSMKNAGIMDGDLLAVHKTGHAQKGQIVVARIEDDVTVKRLGKSLKRHEVLLEPENEEMLPIVVDLREKSFVIEGLGVGVIRTNPQ
ncbi:MAG: repressor LexA [Porticoccus sp.]|jgi:repressor LexA|uniref:transcriptional repressor LexA n=1 Tax=Porticoccus hydrocarbonoclasticus TaxID=1073414 RepID=UPI000563E343|nr:transcriptional repressor LexA [Porticoccus hydrocarbonoclasticus]MBG57034.1 repressor LexA [Porticoccus sp.]|tara:strand:+ start:4579 stop:5196 length:618 start_codon:yes stop_codon:yes gene_type:complete